MPRKKGGVPWTKEDKANYNKTYAVAHKDIINTNRRSRQKTTLQSKFGVILSNAKQRNNVEVSIDFLLELFDKQKGRCALSGEYMTIAATDTRTQSSHVSLDRIDNSLGYTKDNVQLVTAKANYMRGKASISDFKSMCEKVALWLK